MYVVCHTSIVSEVKNLFQTRHLPTPEFYFDTQKISTDREYPYEHSKAYASCNEKLGFMDRTHRPNLLLIIISSLNTEEVFFSSFHFHSIEMFSRLFIFTSSSSTSLIFQSRWLLCNHFKNVLSSISISW